MRDTGICEHCSRDFSYALTHAGKVTFAYCDTCGCTGLISLESKKQGPFELAQGPINSAAEPFLARCRCGGRFRADAAPRCPHCRKTLCPQQAKNYIERNALGAARGWRWQGTWTGAYALVVEGRAVRNPWEVAKPTTRTDSYEAG